MDCLEAARKKRSFEASLPPPGDAGDMQLRLALVRGWEAREWERRAEDIREAQGARLAVLDKELQVRAPWWARG